MPEENVVYVTEREYKELKESQNILSALRVAGVDNWEGYDEAMEQVENKD